MNKQWGPLMTAMATPFTSQGALNLSEAKRLARYLVQEQTNDGIVLCGTTGESPTLSDEEKFSLLQAVLQEVGDSCSVIFGAGSNNTAHSIHLAKQAEKLGAHGIMVVNPYYNKPGQRGLEAHFTAVAQSVNLGVMVYNIQGRTSINLETPTLLSIIEKNPNIVAVKEASGNMSQMSDVCRLVPNHVKVYSGDDGLTLPLLSVGGYGVVGVATHLVGAQVSGMIQLFEKHPKQALEIHQSLSEFFEVTFVAVNPTPVKYMLNQIGFNMGGFRLPLVEITDAEKKKVDNVLQRLKLKELVCS